MFRIILLSFSIFLCLGSQMELNAQVRQDKVLTDLGIDLQRMNLAGLSFRVQIGAYNRPVKPDAETYFSLPKVEAYTLEDGMIRYVMPYNYGDIETADLQRKEMVKKGFKDAFIVPFYQNERIGYHEAVKLLKELQAQE